MGTQYSCMSCFLVLVILAFSQLSKCQNSYGVNIKGTGQRSTTYFQSRYSWRPYAPSPERAKNEAYMNYRVSHRKNPGGPNPLHN
ncbi:hypothetical protein Leryth_022765 [Lithospermum erythrorhizon]|nr:hypothetical protein Leryth_022765 [Lithospermum erythrorhizon]